ncbi:MAG: hypothetical protein IPL59_17105 [Candidatus Competibacteraceae bacterium]|nr:hypothetical protein [Candidatus Competibacteraceae bacterium]
MAISMMTRCGRRCFAPNRNIPAGLSLNPQIRHTRESGYPGFSAADWIPADAGMTESESPGKNCSATASSMNFPALATIPA